MDLRSNLFIVAYLAVQLVLPLRGLIHDKHETRGDFSWNMYSQKYSCRYEYTLVDIRGSTATIHFQEGLNDPRKSTKIMHRDRLAGFNHWLCDDMRAYDPEFSGVRGTVRCSHNGAARVELLDPSVDLCTAHEYGVPR